MYKYLGVPGDGNFKWKEHINEVVTKRSKVTTVVHKIRKSLTPECLGNIYQSLA